MATPSATRSCGHVAHSTHTCTFSIHSARCEFLRGQCFAIWRKLCSRDGDAHDGGSNSSLATSCGASFFNRDYDEFYAFTTGCSIYATGVFDLYEPGRGSSTSLRRLTLASSTFVVGDADADADTDSHADAGSPYVPIWTEVCPSCSLSDDIERCGTLPIVGLSGFDSSGVENVGLWNPIDEDFGEWYRLPASSDNGSATGSWMELAPAASSAQGSCETLDLTFGIDCRGKFKNQVVSVGNNTYFVSHDRVLVTSFDGSTFTTSCAFLTNDVCQRSGTCPNAGTDLPLHAHAVGGGSPDIVAVFYGDVSSSSGGTSVWLFNTVALSWTSLCSGNGTACGELVPSVRADFSSAVVGGFLYIFGGIGRTTLNDLWAIDIGVEPASSQTSPAPADTLSRRRWLLVCGSAIGANNASGVAIDDSTGVPFSKCNQSYEVPESSVPHQLVAVRLPDDADRETLIFFGRGGTWQFDHATTLALVSNQSAASTSDVTSPLTTPHSSSEGLTSVEVAAVVAAVAVSVLVLGALFYRGLRKDKVGPMNVTEAVNAEAGDAEVLNDVDAVAADAGAVDAEAVNANSIGVERVDAEVFDIDAADVKAASVEAIGGRVDSARYAHTNGSDASDTDAEADDADAPCGWSAVTTNPETYCLRPESSEAGVFDRSQSAVERSSTIPEGGDTHARPQSLSQRSSTELECGDTRRAAGRLMSHRSSTESEGGKVGTMSHRSSKESEGGSAGGAVARMTALSIGDVVNSGLVDIGSKEADVSSERVNLGSFTSSHGDVRSSLPSRLPRQSEHPREFLSQSPSETSSEYGDGESVANDEPNDAADRAISEVSTPERFYFESGVSITWHDIEEEIAAPHDESDLPKVAADPARDVEVAQKARPDLATSKRRFNNDGRPKSEYKCHICGRGVFGTKEFFEHIKDVHKKKPCFQCNICAKEFTRHANLKNHLKEHLEGASWRFTCNHCGKKFTQKSNLRRHETSVHTHPVKCGTKRRFTCDHCGKKFKQKSNLRRHETSVHTHPVKCGTKGCKERFKTKGEAREHNLAVHGGNQPKQTRVVKKFKCSCKRRFETYALLVAHQSACELNNPGASLTTASSIPASSTTASSMPASSMATAPQNWSSHTLNAVRREPRGVPPLEGATRSLEGVSVVGGTRPVEGFESTNQLLHLARADNHARFGGTGLFPLPDRRPVSDTCMSSLQHEHEQQQHALNSSFGEGAIEAFLSSTAATSAVGEPGRIRTTLLGQLAPMDSSSGISLASYRTPNGDNSKPMPREVSASSSFSGHTVSAGPSGYTSRTTCFEQGVPQASASSVNGASLMTVAHSHRSASHAHQHASTSALQGVAPARFSLTIASATAPRGIPHAAAARGIPPAPSDHRVATATAAHAAAPATAADRIAPATATHGIVRPAAAHRTAPSKTAHSRGRFTHHADSSAPGEANSDGIEGDRSHIPIDQESAGLQSQLRHLIEPPESPQRPHFAHLAPGVLSRPRQVADLDQNFLFPCEGEPVLNQAPEPQALIKRSSSAVCLPKDKHNLSRRPSISISRASASVAALNDDGEFSRPSTPLWFSATLPKGSNPPSVANSPSMTMFLPATAYGTKEKPSLSRRPSISISRASANVAALNDDGEFSRPSTPLWFSAPLPKSNPPSAANSPSMSMFLPAKAYDSAFLEDERKAAQPLVAYSSRVVSHVSTFPEIGALPPTSAYESNLDSPALNSRMEGDRTPLDTSRRSSFQLDSYAFRRMSLSRSLSRRASLSYGT